VAAVAADFAGRVNVLGVAGRGDLSQMQQFVTDTGVGNVTHVVDEGGDIWAGFGVIGQPAFAFVNDDGSVEVVLGRQGVSSLTEAAERLLGS
jgi:hypothetical protein